MNFGHSSGLYSAIFDLTIPAPSSNRSSMSSYQSPSKKRKRSLELTIPVSPNFQSNLRKRNNGMSSEDIEQLRYQEEVENKRIQRIKKEERMAKAITGNPINIVRSVQLTEPEEFQFATTVRFGERPGHAQDDMEIEYSPAQKKRKLNPGEVTVPEPFHFQSDDRSKFRQLATNSDYENYIPPPTPLAVKVKKIANATPDRFKRHPTKQKSPQRPLTITQPEEFRFETDMRKKLFSLYEEPTPEPEVIPIFKAKPLNKKILQTGGVVGVPRINKRPATVPESPKFATKERALFKPTTEELIQKKEEEMAEMRKFKAKPVMYHTMTERQNYQAPKTKPLTVPQSPMLNTRERAYMKDAEKPMCSDMELSPIHQFKAKPMPVYRAQHAPQHYQPRSLTNPEPFNLRSVELHDQYSEKMQQKKLDEEKKMIQKSQFKAQPMPIASPFRPVLELKYTEPEPFALESDPLHQLAMEKLEERKQSEKEALSLAQQFKAKSFVDRKPAPLKRSSKPLTEVTDYVLNSDRRSEKRSQFDKDMEQKLKAAEEAEARRQQLEAEKQKRELKLQKKDLMFHAKPVPSTLYRSTFVPKRSEQPLTDPKTPNFASKKLKRTTGKVL